MTQESLSRQAREQRAGDELADRLDALSRTLAERVLGRAIELDHQATTEAEAATETMDYDTLREIALEVGISEESLKRALLEELNTEKDHNAGPVERLTAPDAVRGGLIVDGRADEVADRLRSHLSEVEGFQELRHAGPFTAWEAGGRRRQSAQTWTVTQARNDRQLVEVDIETARARRRGWRWIIAIVILSMLFGNAFGALVMLGIWIAGVVAVVSWIKRISRRARRSINRALGALVDDDAARKWLDLFEGTRR